MSLQFRRHDFDHFDMSVAKEGKVFDKKKPLQPFLYTHEGIEMGCIIFFFTSSTLTVYSIEHPCTTEITAIHQTKLFFVLCAEIRL